MINEFSFFFLNSCIENSKTVTPESVGLSSDSLKLAETKMQEYIDQGKLSGISTMVIKNGITVERANFGFADIENNKPIEWVKVYNLPDHVYFNHAQHVNVGKLECAQCHGEVEKMDEIIQIPDLSMGWCIECHDKKQIEVGPTAANPYYQEIHNRLTLRPDVYKKIKEDGEITVKELGGWECAKCHY